MYATPMLCTSTTNTANGISTCCELSRCRFLFRNVMRFYSIVSVWGTNVGHVSMVFQFQVRMNSISLRRKSVERRYARAHILSYCNICSLNVRTQYIHSVHIREKSTSTKRQTTTLRRHHVITIIDIVYQTCPCASADSNLQMGTIWMYRTQLWVFTSERLCTWR